MCRCWRLSGNKDKMLSQKLMFVRLSPEVSGKPYFVLRIVFEYAANDILNF
jgi:hypothetical protein